MYTLGYNFEPWPHPEAIADGPSILKYVKDTANKYGADSRIRLNRRVTKLSWSSETALWTAEILRTDTEEREEMTASFVIGATGYYDYAEPYTPEFEGRDRFKGDVFHPQHWPEGYDYAGKRVVVIGSGATAVTLVPAMADTAAHVTMLQRSPSYLVALPRRDKFINFLNRFLPDKVAYGVGRWKGAIRTMGSFTLAQRFPKPAKRILLKATSASFRASTSQSI